MADMSALELEAREISPTLTTVDQVLDTLTGVLFSAALVAGGLLLVPVALMLGVVGSPVIVLAIAYLVARRRSRPPAGLRPATS